MLLRPQEEASIYSYLINVRLNVSLSGGSRKLSLKNAPKPYHGVGNDNK